MRSDTFWSTGSSHKEQSFSSFSGSSLEDIKHKSAQPHKCFRPEDTLLQQVKVEAFAREQQGVAPDGAPSVLRQSKSLLANF